jgi:hypothetical protein
LQGLVHQEWRPSPEASRKYDASIGFVTSNDGGRSWFNQGKEYSGEYYSQEGLKKAQQEEHVFGAGQPCAIVDKKDPQKVHIYYVDWTQQARNDNNVDLKRDQIHYLQTRLLPDGSFDLNYLRPYGDKQTRKPVVPIPDHIPGATWIGNPSVSWNDYLGRYLMVAMTNAGIVKTTSQDAIHWDPASILMPFTAGDTHEYNYPTMLTEQQPSNLVTGQHGLLLYSHRKSTTEPHQLVTAPYRLTR